MSAALIPVAGGDEDLLKELMLVLNEAGRLDPNPFTNATEAYAGTLQQIGMFGPQCRALLNRCQNITRLFTILKAVQIGKVAASDVPLWVRGQKGIDVGSLLTSIREGYPDFLANENAGDY